MSGPDADQSYGDATMRAALLSVVTIGLAIAVGCAAFVTLRFAAGALIGGLLAAANLAVFARLGQVFLGGQGRTAPWAIVALLKLVVLFGGIWLLLKSELVSGISLAIGYAALPLGIVLGALVGPKPPEEPADFSGNRPPSQRNGTPSANPNGDVIQGKPRSPGAPSDEP